MIIYGKNAIAERVKNGGTFDRVLVQKGNRDGRIVELIKAVKNTGAPVFYRDKEVMEHECNHANHQGIIAYVTDFVYSELDDIFAVAEQSGKPPFIVVLDGIEDPHNLGAICRVCECAGVHGIVIGKTRCATVTEVTVKVAAGATEYVKIARVSNINDAIEKIKQRNVWVYCLETGGDCIYSTDLTGAIALVVGGEGGGVHKLTRSRCDGVISLPLEGKINSLNASVAAGIAVYEKMRQQHVKDNLPKT